jgi:hypothetical protein
MTYLSLDSSGEVVQSDHPIPAPGCSPRCSTRTHGHCGGWGCSPHRHPGPPEAPAEAGSDTDPTAEVQP